MSEIIMEGQFGPNGSSAGYSTEPVDQHVLAGSVAEKVPFFMLKDVLVKPLGPIMVQREFDVPVKENELVYDENLGMDVTEIPETTKEVKEVESAFGYGIVIGLPPYSGEGNWPFKIGDMIYYNRRMAIDFDIFKDSKLVKPYDIVAKNA